MRLLKGLSIFVIVILVSLLLLIEGLYRDGLKALPEDTNPSKSIYSRDLLYAQWVELKGSGDIKMQAMYPISFIIAFFIANKESPYNYLPKSSTLASQAGRHLLLCNVDRKTVKNGRWHLNSVAAMFWVSQNWTAQEALNTVLDSNYYGNQLFGIRAAAKAYFKKMPNELNLDEIIFLVALSKGPSVYDPTCYPERLLKHMNRLRELLSLHYPQLYVGLKPINMLSFNSAR